MTTYAEQYETVPDPVTQEAPQKTGEYKDNTQTYAATSQKEIGNTNNYTPEQAAKIRSDGLAKAKQDWAALSPEQQKQYYDAGGAPEWAEPQTGGALPNPDGTEPGLMDRTQEDSAYDEAAAIGPDGYAIESPDAQVTNRQVGQDEMAGVQLERLLDRNSELSRRAMQSGKDFAASRGLMNSSIAGGNAYGAWVDRATPLAMDQAKTYQQTASDNMAATNAGGLQDASGELQANLAEAGYDAKRDDDLRGAKIGESEDERRARIGIENREDTQKYNSDERAAIEAFTKGERMDTQDWTDEQRAAVERYQTDERLAGEGYNTAEREAIQAYTRGERIDTQNFTDEQRKAVQDYQTSERQKVQDWNTSERKAGQSFTSSERRAIEAFQNGERLDTQEWTNEQREAVERWQTEERMGTEEFQWKRDRLDESIKLAGIAQEDRAVFTQAWAMVEMGKFQSIGQAGAAIYGNTELTASEQRAAIQNMIAFFNGIAPDVPPATGPQDPYDPPPGGGDGITPANTGVNGLMD